jgi:hypothetical protein
MNRFVLATALIFLTASPVHALASNSMPSCSSDDMQLMVWRSIMADDSYAHGRINQDGLHIMLKRLLASNVRAEDQKRIDIVANSVPGLNPDDVETCRVAGPDDEPAMQGIFVLAYIRPGTDKIVGFVAGFDSDNPKAAEKLLDIKDINAADRKIMDEYGISKFDLWVQQKESELSR